MNLKHLYYFWKVATTGSVVGASDEIHITPQTISGQIQLLEQDLGSTLFKRRGRKLELTEAGRLALGYAEEIFSLESELEEMLRLRLKARPLEFRVGVADAVPKSLAYRLLAPAMNVPDAVTITCREWKLDSLLSELAVHRLDLVIADAPLPQSVDVRAYNHRLGESPVTFFAAPQLAARLPGAFPECIDKVPLLVPGEDSAIRSKLLRWLDRRKLHPRFAGEFDGSSLMAAFGQAGVGVFVAPSTMEDDLRSQFGVIPVGRTGEITAEYYAISVERRLSHPCVLAITRCARDWVFAPKPF